LEIEEVNEDEEVEDFSDEVVGSDVAVEEPVADEKVVEAVIEQAEEAHEEWADQEPPNTDRDAHEAWLDEEPIVPTEE